MPLLALRGLVVFPGSIAHFDVGRPRSVSALKEAMDRDKLLFLVTQKDLYEEEPLPEDLYTVGVVVRVHQVMQLPGENYHIIAECLYRAKLGRILHMDSFLEVQAIECECKSMANAIQEQAMENLLLDQFAQYEKMDANLPPEALHRLESTSNLGEMCDLIASFLKQLKIEEAQELLETFPVSRRSKKVLNILLRETKVKEVETEILEKAQDHIDENQREYYLHEQLRAISEELGDGDNPVEEAEEFRKKIAELPLSDDNREKLLKECSKLAKMPFGSHEASVIRVYLETCIGLPWDKTSAECTDIVKARDILDRDHYGLKDVKERILEILAVRALSDSLQGQVICLVGPPGVGKTSIAKSIAEATGRAYARVSLGGVRDESEIRGHRRTYIGSMMGRIMDAVNKAGTSNPLILLDEVDKLGNDFRGDPASALLEVLDTEQNCRFVDHYVDLDFDLSNVLFITTANDQSAIPTPLLDRMDLIALDGYTEQEKIHIAKDHLVKKQLKQNGLNAKQLSFSEPVIRAIITGYTREAGVRTLERTIGKVCRIAAKKVVEGQSAPRLTVKNLKEHLGAPRYVEEDLAGKNEIGVANGLAWTSVGGELLPIEVAVLEGSGKIELTGSLGDVMKESAKIAVSYVRAHAEEYGIDKDFYKTRDLHIHAPEGAVPKDGPSAGVTMVTALVSALSGYPVSGQFAMTGEISLRGKVLPIGGLKEKAMAAYTHQMKKVLIPEQNQADLEKLDPEVRNGLEFIPVSTVEQVLSKVLLIPKKKKSIPNGISQSRGLTHTEVPVVSAPQ